MIVYGFPGMGPGRLRKAGLSWRYYSSAAKAGEENEDQPGDSLMAATFDVSELDGALVSHFSRSFPDLVRVSEPCLGFAETYGKCRNCSVAPVPDNYECKPNVPYALPLSPSSEHHQQQQQEEEEEE